LLLLACAKFFVLHEKKSRVLAHTRKIIFMLFSVWHSTERLKRVALHNDQLETKLPTKFHNSTICCGLLALQHILKNP
jgi:hypothetical protein